MKRLCIACGRTLHHHKHGKRRHCSGKCAALATRLESEARKSRDPVSRPR